MNTPPSCNNDTARVYFTRYHPIVTMKNDIIDKGGGSMAASLEIASKTKTKDITQVPYTIPYRIPFSQSQQMLHEHTLNAMEMGIEGYGGSNPYNHYYNNSHHHQQNERPVIGVPTNFLTYSIATPPTSSQNKNKSNKTRPKAGIVAAATAFASQPHQQETIHVPNRYPDAVFIAFFEHGEVKFTDLTDWIIQKRMKWVSPRYEHCQIVFMWQPTSKTHHQGRQCRGNGSGGNSTYVTFSTNKERPSLYTNPAYKNENWRGLNIPQLNQSPEARNAVFEWCESNKNTPFNTCAFYWNFIPPATCCSCCQYDSGGSSYFCAEQVASALAHAHVPLFDDAKPWSATPDSIYDLIIEGGGATAVLKTPTFIFPRNLKPLGGSPTTGSFS